jgi:hypothetical protein
MVYNANIAAIMRQYLVILVAIIHHCISFHGGRQLGPYKLSMVLSNVQTKLTKDISLPESDRRYYWDLSKVAFSLLPIYPSVRRKTLIEEPVKGQIWTLDQLQGIINVNVPVRAVVVKLKSGGLLIYNPVAPTQECIEFVRNLEKGHGKVKYIILGTLGLEHKAFLGPFSNFFPESNVYVQSGQWSFPINLPNSFLGFPLGRRLQTIPTNASTAPWHADLDHIILDSLHFKSVGGFGETAMFHRSSRTLLVTDCVVQVSSLPSPIIEEDPRALLYHSRNKMLDNVIDTPEARLRGWRRMILFALTFYPSAIEVAGIAETLSKIPQLNSKVNLLGYGTIPITGGLYPWTWSRSEETSFQALTGGLLVAPILRSLILNREPRKVLDWVDSVIQWDFIRIIPSHLQNNIATTPKEFKRAFSFLNASSKEDQQGSAWSFLEGKSKMPAPLPDDMKLLNTLSDVLTKFGVVAPEGQSTG